MKKLLIAALLALPLAAAATPPATVPAPEAVAGPPVMPADAKLSNKWRLQFSGAAESPGELEFELTDTDGAAFRVVVAIEGNDGENRVASKVRRALDKQLPRGWRVERDDGEDVLLKRRFYHPRFHVALVRSTVKGVRINFDRE